ncbi:unnamed protein product [Closterium sp. NIES-64]|nr:unnamed protein product [Closterium sp. NIES-64]
MPALKPSCRSLDVRGLAGPSGFGGMQLLPAKNNVIIRFPNRSLPLPLHAALSKPGMEACVPAPERYMVAFHYGSVVFFNFDRTEEALALDIVTQHCTGAFKEAHSDGYCVIAQHRRVARGGVRAGMTAWRVIARAGLKGWSEGGHDYVAVRQLDVNNIRVISSILGQSVALDHYARKVDEMVNTFSELNRGMEQSGTFTMTRKKLFQLVAAANTTLADVILRIGLLERSDTAWRHAEYSKIWEFLRDDFELDERFESLDFKLNIIQWIADSGGVNATTALRAATGKGPTKLLMLKQRFVPKPQQTKQEGDEKPAKASNEDEYIFLPSLVTTRPFFGNSCSSPSCCTVISEPPHKSPCSLFPDSPNLSLLPMQVPAIPGYHPPHSPPPTSLAVCALSHLHSFSSSSSSSSSSASSSSSSFAWAPFLHLLIHLNAGQRRALPMMHEGVGMQPEVPEAEALRQQYEGEYTAWQQATVKKPPAYKSRRKPKPSPSQHDDNAQNPTGIAGSAVTQEEFLGAVTTALVSAIPLPSAALHATTNPSATPTRAERQCSASDYSAGARTCSGDETRGGMEEDGEEEGEGDGRYELAFVPLMHLLGRAGRGSVADIVLADEGVETNGTETGSGQKGGDGNGDADGDGDGDADAEVDAPNVQWEVVGGSIRVVATQPIANDAPLLLPLDGGLSGHFREAQKARERRMKARRQRRSEEKDGQRREQAEETDKQQQQQQQGEGKEKEEEETEDAGEEGYLEQRWARESNRWQGAGAGQVGKEKQQLQLHKRNTLKLPQPSLIHATPLSNTDAFTYFGVAPKSLFLAQFPLFDSPLAVLQAAATQVPPDFDPDAIESQLKIAEIGAKILRAVRRVKRRVVKAVVWGSREERERLGVREEIVEKVRVWEMRRETRERMGLEKTQGGGGSEEVGVRGEEGEEEGGEGEDREDGEEGQGGQGGQGGVDVSWLEGPALHVYSLGLMDPEMVAYLTAFTYFFATKEEPHYSFFARVSVAYAWNLDGKTTCTHMPLISSSFPSSSSSSSSSNHSSNPLHISLAEFPQRDHLLSALTPVLRLVASTLRELVEAHLAKYQGSVQEDAMSLYYVPFCRVWQRAGVKQPEKIVKVRRGEGWEGVERGGEGWRGVERGGEGVREYQDSVLEDAMSICYCAEASSALKLAVRWSEATREDRQAVDDDGIRGGGARAVDDDWIRARGAAAPHLKHPHHPPFLYSPCTFSHMYPSHQICEPWMMTGLEEVEHVVQRHLNQKQLLVEASDWLLLSCDPRYDLHLGETRSWAAGEAEGAGEGVEGEGEEGREGKEAKGGEGEVEQKRGGGGGVVEEEGGEAGEVEDDEERKLRAFIKWVQQRGIKEYGTDESPLKFHFYDHRDVAPSLTNTSDPSAATNASAKPHVRRQMSMVAGRDVHEGEVLLTIPQSLWITAEVAAEEMPPHTGPVNTQVAMVAWLLREKARGRQSEWWPYIDILPPYVPLPHRFRNDSLDEAQSDLLKLLVHQQREVALMEYKQVRPPAMAFASFDDYMWAHSILDSRAFSVPIKELSGLDLEVAAAGESQDLRGGSEGDEKEKRRRARERRRAMANAPGELVEAVNEAVGVLHESPRRVVRGVGMALITAAELLDHQINSSIQYNVSGGSHPFAAPQKARGDWVLRHSSRRVVLTITHQFEYIAMVNVSAGSELATSYGPKTNDQLLATYGFVLDANPFDGAPLFENLTEAVGVVAALLANGGRGVGGRRGEGSGKEGEGDGGVVVGVLASEGARELEEIGGEGERKRESEVYSGEVYPGEVELKRALEEIWLTEEPPAAQAADGADGSSSGGSSSGGEALYRDLLRVAAKAVAAVVAEGEDGNYTDVLKMPQYNLKQRVNEAAWKRVGRRSKGERRRTGASGSGGGGGASGVAGSDGGRGGDGVEGESGDDGEDEEVEGRKKDEKERMAEEQEVAVWAYGVVEPTLLASLAAMWHVVHYEQGAYVVVPTLLASLAAVWRVVHYEQGLRTQLASLAAMWRIMHCEQGVGMPGQECWPLCCTVGASLPTTGPACTPCHAARLCPSFPLPLLPLSPPEPNYAQLVLGSVLYGWGAFANKPNYSQLTLGCVLYGWGVSSNNRTSWHLLPINLPFPIPPMPPSLFSPPEPNYAQLALGCVLYGWGVSSNNRTCLHLLPNYSTLMPAVVAAADTIHLLAEYRLARYPTTMEEDNTVLRKLQSCQAWGKGLAGGSAGEGTAGTGLSGEGSKSGKEERENREDRKVEEKGKGGTEDKVEDREEGKEARGKEEFHAWCVPILPVVEERMVLVRYRRHKKKVLQSVASRLHRTCVLPSLTAARAAPPGAGHGAGGSDRTDSPEADPAEAVVGEIA